MVPPKSSGSSVPVKTMTSIAMKPPSAPTKEQAAQNRAASNLG